jgi:hypothetical protein
MLRLRRVLAASTTALLLSLPVAAQPPRSGARPGLAAAVLSGAGAALHRLWDGLRLLCGDVHGTLDPDGHT